jgi:hypothetical protein
VPGWPILSQGRREVVVDALQHADADAHDAFR